MKPRLLLLAAFALAACREEDAILPDPVAMNADSLGHFCQMNLLEHAGPKAQVHLEGMPYPLFFSQVRDAVAYARMPESDGVITAIYVSDMSAAPSWEDPGAENWVLAEEARYVVGAAIEGGMGAPELVPFSTPEDAVAFAAERGGTVVQLTEIADEDVLAPVEFRLDEDGNFLPPENAPLH